jgi:squalene synthase HpnC
MAVDHYENFPVASWLLPARFRRPVELIYRFAREADDFADEGDAAPQARLAQLQQFNAALDDIEAGRDPRIPWFRDLGAIIAQHSLPVQALRDLLSAFAQDVTRTRYARFADVLDYCRRSADPVGRLLLVLYGADTDENRRCSDAICTALQLVNFLQDVAIDYQKGRVYLALDELAAHALTVDDIAKQRADVVWSRFMAGQVARTRAMLNSGRPLGHVLRGRLGLEMRTIIAGGSRILDKIDRVQGDVFRRRPVLEWHDWPRMLARAAGGNLC